MSRAAASRAQIDALRRFNRAYTRKLGVLEEQFLSTIFSLTEARVLYELSEGERSASEIGKLLGLDAGYLSRILERFEKAKLITRSFAAGDRRRSFISLTREGKAAYAPLEKRSREEVGRMLNGLSPSGQAQMLDAMATVAALADSDRNENEIVLRTHGAGDMGWITMRHGALYADEYGYGPQFEALVADICAQFLKSYDEKSERCIIAELNNVRAGSVCLVRAGKKTAKLRLMFLEPWARGQGVAQKLVDECISFARSRRYEKIELWTQSELLAARKLYARAGFRLIGSQPHTDFGKKLIGENWELKL
jgi:DNA-binding MarR family transcriptional regulator/GNAT superfamily N-acetyltransferase